MILKFASSLVILFFLSLTFSTLSIADEDKILSGCGSTRDEARKELGNTIHTLVKSTTSIETTVEDNTFFDIFSTKARVTNDQLSKVALCNVAVEKKGDQFCASVSHKALTECAQKKLDAQMTYLIKNLPEIENVKLIKAGEWLDEITYSENLYTYLGVNNFDKEKYDKLTSIRNDLLKLLDNQYVRFDIEGASSKITLLASKKTIPSNKDIAMKVGTYAYEITSPGYCTINGSFELTAKGRSVIKYDLAKYTYPEITFTSNLPNVQLKVGGENSKVGDTKTIKRCDGNLAYSFTLKDVTKEGEVKLQPGLKTGVRGKFTPIHLLEFAKSYRSGQLWQVQVMSILPNHKSNQIDKLSGFKVSRSTLQNSFRWGFHGAFATDNEDAYAYELSANFSLQMLDYNNGREALTLGPLLIVPSAGIEAGLAYHDMNGVSTFEDTDASEWKNIYQSYIILRPIIGLDATFNKDFGFSMSYSRSIYMNKSDIFSIGMLFKF